MSTTRSLKKQSLTWISLLYIFVVIHSLIHASTASTRHSNSHTLPASISPHATNKTLYKPLFQKPSNSTPRFLNITHREVNPQRLAAAGTHNHKPRSVDLFKRQSGPSGTGTCAPGSPCSNGACCSSSGFCGYSPDFCGSTNCISNCDAKAQCGKYALAGKQKCPLNVCCSQYGMLFMASLITRSITKSYRLLWHNYRLLWYGL